MSNAPRVLVIEDEYAMRTAIYDCLVAEGYRVLCAYDGATGLERATHQKPDLVLLDIMLPKLDGFSLCRELRRVGPPVPILMLTAKGQLQDRVKGLDTGADDYLTKPFETDELLARIRALLRRSERQNASLESLRLGRITIDFRRQWAFKGRKPLELSAKEWAMLKLLAQAEGAPVSREDFLDAVWGYTAFPTTRTVDNYIAKLRAKIEPDPNHPTWIHTVQGVGYRLSRDKDSR